MKSKVSMPLGRRQFLRRNKVLRFAYSCSSSTRTIFPVISKFASLRESSLLSGMKTNTCKTEINISGTTVVLIYKTTNLKQYSSVLERSSSARIRSYYFRKGASYGSPTPMVPWFCIGASIIRIASGCALGFIYSDTYPVPLVHRQAVRWYQVIVHPHGFKHVPE